METLNPQSRTALNWSVLHTFITGATGDVGAWKSKTQNRFFSLVSRAQFTMYSLNISLHKAQFVEFSNYLSLRVIFILGNA